jgi:DNA adenine methylase
MSAVKPFLKWAGGKTSLLPEILNNLPDTLKQGKVSVYAEPFLGSGAVFISLSSRYSFKKVYLCDVNVPLVNTYIMVRDMHEALIQKLNRIKKDFCKLSEVEKKSFYYKVRTRFNKYLTISKPVTAKRLDAARDFIFMNKTGYNGLCRFNKQGAFNVPYGRYKNHSIYDADNIAAVSGLLSKAHITVGDFGNLTKMKLKNAFIYYDPPYRPISKSSAFTAYFSNDFNDEEQIRLRDMYVDLHKKSNFQMLSNSDPKNNNAEDCFFDDLYKNFTLNRVEARRYINSKSDKRGPVKELLIVNY